MGDRRELEFIVKIIEFLPNGDEMPLRAFAFVIPMKKKRQRFHFYLNDAFYRPPVDRIGKFLKYFIVEIV